VIPGMLWACAFASEIDGVLVMRMSAFWVAFEAFLKML
jgi:hypothetical protein